MNKRTTLIALLAAMMAAATPSHSSAKAGSGIDETNILQQTGKVTGRVVGQDGEPIVGASVVERSHTTNGAMTDAMGRFTLNVHSAKAQLIVSFVGYETKTVSVTNGKADIVLTEKDTDLDEAVVVAFGKQKRESFTGSAGAIGSQKISQRQVENAIVALNGQVAGVQMVEGNGPGSEPTLRIRGISSINASSSPLIIVDGLPFNGYWSDINPADVESVTVQKDAASNALYGARGANGVVFVTTKNAKRGRAQISFDARWGSNMDGKVDYDKITSAGQYYETHYAALYNYFRNSQGQDAYSAWLNANNTLGLDTADGGVTYLSMTVPEGQYLVGQNGRLNPAATLGRIVTGRDGNEYLIIPDDWKKEGLRNGLREEYNLNLNGGNDQFQTYVSLGYLKNEGIAPGNYYDRYSARMKMDYQARTWLKVGASGSYTHNDYNGQNTTFAVAHDIAPIYPVYLRDAQGNILTDSHGKRYDYGDGTVLGFVRALYNSQNCIQEDLETIYDNNSNAFSFQGYADVTFLRDFKLTVNASVYDTENRQVTTNYPYYGFYALTGGGSSVGHYRTFDFNTQQLLNWAHGYGQHNVSALIGHEYFRNNQTQLYGSKTVFYDYDTNAELDGLLTNNSSGSSKSVYNVEGYFARAMYDYAGRYYLSASYRRDGSSTFAPDYRWGNFWSLGGAWIISKERFMAATEGWIDMLKVKVSYGSQGNDGIGTYRYTDNYNYASTGGRPAYTFSSLGKADITWETNGNFNTGVEFELFGHRLTGGVEYYRRMTTDMLLWVYLPLSYGTSGYYDNVGDMRNQGVELNLDAELIRLPNVSWKVNFNISHNQNRVVKLNDDNKGSVMDGHPGYNSGTKFIGEGLPLYTWRLKKYAGPSPEDGRSMWYYTDGDGNQQTTTSWDKGSYYLCGDANAKAFGGFGTTLALYGFDLAANFVYSIGGLVNDSGYSSLMDSPYSGWTGFSYHKDILNAWTPANTATDVPRFQYGDQNNASMSDRWLISGSYLTLKNVSLGYTIPDGMAQRLQLSKLRFYVSADGIVYWSARKGLDPRNSFSGSASGTGYSPLRTISGGLTVNF